MSHAYQRGFASVRGNLTPMIDVVFLLIVFFVLVSRLVDVESVEMELPHPPDAATLKPGQEQRVIINLLPRLDGTIAAYRVGGQDFAASVDGVNAMTAHLAAAYRRNPAVVVNVRADRATHYEWIEPVLDSVSRAARMSAVPSQPAARPRVNLMVVQER